MKQDQACKLESRTAQCVERNRSDTLNAIFSSLSRKSKIKFIVSIICTSLIVVNPCAAQTIFLKCHLSGKNMWEYTGSNRKYGIQYDSHPYISQQEDAYLQINIDDHSWNEFNVETGNYNSLNECRSNGGYGLSKRPDDCIFDNDKLSIDYRWSADFQKNDRGGVVYMQKHVEINRNTGIYYSQSEDVWLSKEGNSHIYQTYSTQSGMCEKSQRLDDRPKKF